MNNEIELITGRITQTPFDFEGDAKEAINNADKFNLEDELPGFHDYEFGEVTRGYYSFIEPFEVECLEDGIMTAKIEKRIKTAEFMITDKFLFAWGNNQAVKLLSSMISGSFATATKIEFEFQELYDFQNRYKLCKSVKIKNPKENAVRTVNMAGRLDVYTSYNVLDANNHELKSVTGVMATGLGDITITVNANGTIRIGTKKESVIHADFLTWLITLICGGDNGQA